MKPLKKLISALLAAGLMFSLAACDSGGEKGGGKADISADQVGTEDFQKNLHQAIRTHGGLPTFIETDTGYFVGYGWLYYVEKATMKATIVCAKPDCDHQDPETCNALIDANYLLTGGDQLYYVSNIVNPTKMVWSVRPDGTAREKVQDLKFNETSSSQSSNDLAIYHRGYIYYVSDDILYRVKLGGEKDSAEEIWKPEDAGSSQSHADGRVDFNPNAIRYTLWADGDILYFMANVQTTDGTYKDVLFQCGLDGSDVKQVWVTPNKEDVGEWEETGVSVSQWYITNGYIYFYLSGGDMWRAELESGNLEKLANTHEKTQYGSAIFSDEYMCLLNDYPVAFYGDPTLVPGGQYRSYGDTIFVYGLDGALVKEISLSNLYDDPDEMAQMHLLCCIGNDIFFLTIGRHVVSGSGLITSQAKQGAVNLCHANIESGNVAVIYNFR